MASRAESPILCHSAFCPTFLLPLALIIRSRLGVIAWSANSSASLTYPGVRVTPWAFCPVSWPEFCLLAVSLISSAIPFAMAFVGAGLTESVAILLHSINQMTMVAKRFPCINRRLGSTPQGVDFGGYGLKVIGINTELHSAKVVNLEAGGNITHYNGVGDTVWRSSPNYAFAPPRVLSVLVMAQPPGPKPAITTFVNALPEIRKQAVGEINRLVRFPHTRILPEAIRQCPLY